MVSNENEEQQVDPALNGHPAPVVQQGVAEKNLKKALVSLPGGEKRDFFVHKNAKGNILFDLVAESQALLEKDYFGLRFVDEYGEKSWLYPDKRISKQLKNEEWDFVFQVKFYAPEPGVLGDDLTRFLLYLQVRSEIYEGKLPASYPIQVLLAAIVMQAETGDFETTQQSPAEYDTFVKNAHLVPNVDQEFLSKVREAHKEQKGLTTQEAHQKYLDTAKKLAKYGFTFFQGKDSKNGTVTIGVYAHGICVYKDQVQIHRFLWQGIVKILFRGSKFTVVLKEGELDEKKEVSVHYRMPDYSTAKRLYRTAVEHHTFFRLIKPEDKPKPGLLRRWGSDKFRYQGRTYFQAKMASQMFDNPMTAVYRTPSGRQVSRSVDDLARQRSFPTSPMHYVDETTQQISSPEKSKSYSLKLSKAERAKQKADEQMQLTVDTSNSRRSSSRESSESLVSPLSGEYIVRPYSPRDPATISPYEDYPLGLTSEERAQLYSTPTKSNKFSKVRFIDETKIPAPDDGSAVAIAPAIKPGKRIIKRRIFGPVNDDHTAFSPVGDLMKVPEFVGNPIVDFVTVYHKGYYLEKLPVAGNYENGFFLGCCKPQKTLISERIRTNRNDSGLEFSTRKKSEIEHYPIRYFVEVYHSGRSQTELRRKKKFLPARDEDVIEADKINKNNYNFPSDPCFDPDRIEFNTDPETLPLKQYSRVYWTKGHSKPGTAKSTFEVKSEHLPEFTSEEKKIVQILTSKSETEPTIYKVEKIVEEKHEKTVTTTTVTTIKTESEAESTPLTTSTVTHTIVKQARPLEGESEDTVGIMKDQEESGVELESTEFRKEPQGTVEFMKPEAKVEVMKRQEELDQFPIKKFSNIYHSGQSLEHLKTIDWVKKQKALIFMKKRPTEDISRPSTSGETEPFKSSVKLILGKRKTRTFSLSENYPTISEPFEGEISEIHRRPEAPSADLFDCVQFAPDEGPLEEIPVEPVTKKPKYSKAARLCLWCGPNAVLAKKDEYPVDVVPYTGHISYLNQSQEAPTARLLDCVDFETLEAGGSDRLDAHLVRIAREEPIVRKESIKKFKEGYPLAGEPYAGDLEDLTRTRDVEREALREYVEAVPEGVSYSSPKERRESRESVKILKEKQEVVQRSRIPSKSGPYPVIGEKFEGELENLQRNPEAESSILVQEVQFQVEESDPGSLQLDPHLRKIEPTKKSEKNIVQESPKQIRQIPQGYPSSEPFEGEISSLGRKPEAPTSDIFESVSFVQNQIEIPQREIEQTPEKKKLIIFWQKKQKLPEIEEEKENAKNRLWCGPLIRRRKDSEEEEKKSRTFSLSKGYPEIGQAYEGELQDLAPMKQAESADLFESVQFAPPLSAENQVFEDKEVKTEKVKSKTPREWNLNCVSRPKRAESEESIPSIKGTVQEKQIHRRTVTKRSRLYSTSKGYPEIGEVYEGELVEIAPVKQAESANLFDCVDFAPEEEEVFEDKEVKTEKAKSKTPREWNLNCVSRPKRTESEESIPSIKGTVQEKQIHRRTVTKRSRLYSTSKGYPEIGEEYEGEIQELVPVKQADTANLFDCVSFASEEEVKVEKEPKTPKDWNLICISKKAKRAESEESIPSVKGTVHEKQLARITLTKRSRLYSLSKGYPEIGEPYEGELVEIAPAKQADTANLFDCVQFVPTEEEVFEKKEIKTEKVKSKTPREWNLNCVSRPKRSESEESIPSIKGTVQEKQIHRRTVTKRSRLYSTSKGYPEIGEEYEGEIQELVPIKQAESANLFDCVSFASTSEDSGIEEDQKAQKSQSGLWCGPLLRRSKKEASEQQETRSVYSLSKGYPEIGQAYEGELQDLAPVKQAESADLFQSVQFAPPLSAENQVFEDKEVKTEKVKSKTPREWNLNCVSRPKRAESEESIPSIKGTVQEKQIHRRTVTKRSRLYSTSKGYPEIGEIYEGQIQELAPEKQADTANLFDCVDFASEEEEVFEKKEVKTEKVKSKTPREWNLNCVSRPKRSESEESIPSIKGTVQEKQIHRRTVTKRSRLYSTSKGYPEIGEVYEGKLVEIAPAKQADTANLFDCVSFASEEELVKVEEKPKESKSRIQWLPICGANLQSVRDKGYPEIGEKYEGELEDLSPCPDAASADLFSHVHFAENIPKESIKSETQVQSSEGTKKKFKGLLWWKRAPDSVQEKTQKKIKGYPEIGQVYEGEVRELNRRQDAESGDLKEHVEVKEFAEYKPKEAIQKVEQVQVKKIQDYPEITSPFTGEVEELQKTQEAPSESIQIEGLQVTKKKQKAKITIRPKSVEKEEYPAPEEPFNGDVEELQKTQEAPSEPIVLEQAQKKEESPSEAVQVEEVRKKKKKQKTKVVTRSKPTESGFPLPGEPFTGDISQLSRNTEITSSEIFEKVNFEDSHQLDSALRPKIPLESPQLGDYPEICEPFLGELSSLQKSPEAESGKLFDHVNFRENEDSEGSYRLNAHLRSIRRKHVALAETPEVITKTIVPPGYPEITPLYTGELQELRKVPEANFADLFDCISFNSTAIEEKLEPTVLQKLLLPVFLCAAPSRNKKPLQGYPEITAPYEGEIFTIYKQPEAPSADLFDCVSFASTEEENRNGEVLAYRASSTDSGFGEERPSKKYALWCGPEINRSKKKHLKTDKEETRSVYSLSKGYPEIGQVYEGELQDLAPVKQAESADLFQSVQFAPPLSAENQVFEDKEVKTEKVKSKTPREWNLNCVSRPKRAESEESIPSIKGTVQEKQIHRRTVTKRSRLYSTSKGYPEIGEEYEGEIQELVPEKQADTANLFDCVSFASEEEQLVEKKEIKAKERKPKKEPKDWNLFCTKIKRADSEESIPSIKGTVQEKQIHRRTVTKRSRLYSTSKGYPEIGEEYEGEIQELVPIKQADTANLFDCVDFAPEEEEVFEKKEVKTEKAKSKTPREWNLNCVSRPKRSESEESIPSIKGTVQEKQIHRRTVTKRSRLYSTSKGYPEIGETYEGEIQELVPVKQADTTNLFDCVDFASEEELSKETKAEAKKKKESKKSRDWNLVCPAGLRKRAGSDESIPSIKGTVQEKQIHRRTVVPKSRTYSTSKGYPEIGEMYEGEIQELVPAQQAESTNLFDCVDFAPEEEEVFEKKEIKTEKVKSKTPREWNLNCVSRPKRSESEESIPSIKGTVQEKQIHRRTVTKRSRLYSTSKGYPEIGEEYEGEIQELTPEKQAESANLFDCVSFASEEEQPVEKKEVGISEKTKEAKTPRDWHLNCISLPKRPKRAESEESIPSIKGTIQEKQIHRRTVTKRSRLYSTSKGYPEIGETYEGELVEIAPVKQADTANLFDCVDFASEEEEVFEKKEIKTEKVKSKTPREWNLNCVSRPKRSESEESIPSIKGTVQEKQIHRRTVTKRSRLYSTSKGYPEIGEEYEGEIQELVPVKQADTANLFDCVDFASEEEVENAQMNASVIVDKSQKRRLPICLPCTSGNREPKIGEHDVQVEEEPYGGEFRETIQKPEEIATEVGETVEAETPKVTVEKVEEIKVKKSKLLGYPEVEEPFTGEISELQKNKEADSEDLFEHVQFLKEEGQSGSAQVDSELKLINFKKTVIQKTPKGYPEKSDPFIGNLEDLKKDQELSNIEISECVSEVPGVSLTSKPPKIRTSPVPIIVEEVASPTQSEHPESYEYKELQKVPEVETSEFSVVPEIVEEKTEIQEPIREIGKQEKEIHFQKLPRFQLRGYRKSKLHGYPEISQPFEGEISELGKQSEIENHDLFDYISFQSNNEDSGLGGESTVKKELKEKAIGLWCGPGIKKFKNKEEKKERKYSLSKNYPEIGQVYEGELQDLTPAKQAESADLFQSVQFAPPLSAENQVFEDKEVKTEKVKSKTPREWNLNCVSRPKRSESEESIPSIKGTVQEKQIHRRTVTKRSRLYSTSKGYPEIGEEYEGEIQELAPEKQADTANLFDCVSFASEEEQPVEKKEVGISEKTKEAKTPRDWHLNCISLPKRPKRAESEESIPSIKGTIQEKQIHRRTVTKRSRLYSTSKGYPEIGEEYEGEIQELAPEKQADTANLFDCVDFASEEEEVFEKKEIKTEKVKPKTPREWNLNCVSRPKRSESEESIPSIKGTVQEKQIHRRTVTKRSRLYSTSKGYPEIGEEYEGEIQELVPIKQADTANLFDCVSFASEEEVKVEKEPKTPKDWNLICISKKAKRAESEESIPSVKGTVHEKQLARITLTKRSRLYSLSKGYPEIGEPYEGELVEIAPAKQADTANLFDCVQFVPTEEEVFEKKEIKTEKVKSKTPREWNLNCVSRPKRSESEESIPSIKGTVQEKQIHRRTVTKRSRLYSTSKGYPEIGEEYEGEVEELIPEKQAESANLFDCVSFASDEEEAKELTPLKVTIPTSESKHSQVSKLLWCSPALRPTKLEGYPPITEPFSGELSELSSQPEAPSANLFDTISFASNGEEGSRQQKIEPKKIQSPVSQTSTKKTVWVLKGKPPSAEGYPPITEPFNGELSELHRVPEADSADLFECVSFVPGTPPPMEKSKSVEKEIPKRKLRLFGRKRLSRADMGLDIRAYPKTEAYEGPLEDLRKKSELESDPLRTQIRVYHSGFSVPFGKPGFERIRHEGIEEVSDAPEDYPIVVFEGEADPIYPFTHETLPLRAFAKLPVMDKMEQLKTPKDLRKKRSRSQATVESDSDSTSQEEKIPPRSPKSEGFLNFFKNRLGSKSVGKKKTGFENLIEPGESKNFKKEENIQDYPILEHVHVYHNGMSTQQAIDSGFEEGPALSADESKKVGTLYLKGKSKFFDKFKISKDANEKTVEEIEEGPVTVETKEIQTTVEKKEGPITVERKSIIYDFDTSPFLGLCSSTVLHRDLEEVPLITVVENIPEKGYYDRNIQTPTSEVTSSGEEQKESKIEMIGFVKKKSKKDPYRFSSEKFQGEYSEVKKDENLSEFPIGEHVMVYHCGRSDVQSPEVPKEVFEGLQDSEKKTAVIHITKAPEVFEKEIYDLEKESEAVQEPMKVHVNVYDSGAASEGQKEVVEELQESRFQKTSEIPFYRRLIPILKKRSLKNYPAPEVFEGEIPDLKKKSEATEEPMKIHVNVYHSGVSSAGPQKVEKVQSSPPGYPIYRRIILRLRRPLRHYPVVGESFDGDLVEVQKSPDLPESELKNSVNLYHSGFSDFQKRPKFKNLKRKLNVNLNDYPSDSGPVEGQIFELSVDRDLPKSPAPFSAFDRVQSSKNRGFGRFWELRGRRSRAPAGPFAISGINKREDFSDTRFSTIVTDKSLFEKDHWPVTDIDADVILKKERKIDCECEATIVIEKNFSKAIGGGVSFGPKGSSEIVQTSSGKWFAKTSFKIEKPNSQEAEQVEKSRTALREQVEFEREDLFCLAEDPVLEKDSIFEEDFISDDPWLAEGLTLPENQENLLLAKSSTLPENRENLVLAKSSTLPKNQENLVLAKSHILPKNQQNLVLAKSHILPEKNFTLAKSSTLPEDNFTLAKNHLLPEDSDLAKGLTLTKKSVPEKNPIFEKDQILPEDELTNISKMHGSYFRGLSPSTWRRKLKEGGLFSRSNINGDPMAHSTTAVTPTDSGMFASLRRRFSEKLAKKERKKEEKRRKKEEKEAKKKAKKIGQDVNSSSSSSSGSASDAEIEERHVVISQAVAGPVEPLKKNRELGDTVEEDKHRQMAPQNSVGGVNIDPNSSGPYTPAKEKDGRVIREETIEQVYRISGTGHAPKFDPNDMSLFSTVQKCKQETDRVPRVQMVEANVLVKEKEPLPQALREGSAPHTTVHTWHETEAGPETVVTEVDKYGNKVTRTIKTQHSKHTIQKQTYQTYAVDENQPRQKIQKTEETHTPLNNESIARSPVINTHTRTVAYEKGNEPDRGDEPLGDLVSSKTITTGNRTVEILTYKTEKDGIVETRVEHRVTIHSGDNIDHDAELAKALLEATQLSPDLIINRVEVEKSTQH